MTRIAYEVDPGCIETYLSLLAGIDETTVSLCRTAVAEGCRHAKGERLACKGFRKGHISNPSPIGLAAQRLFVCELATFVD